MIDRGADDIIIGRLVQGLGGNAGLHQGGDEVQDLGGQPAGPAHAVEILLAVQGDGKMGLAGGVEDIAVGNDGHREPI
jgi:hypothetical protein